MMGVGVMTAPGTPPAKTFFVRRGSKLRCFPDDTMLSSLVAVLLKAAQHDKFVYQGAYGDQRKEEWAIPSTSDEAAMGEFIWDFSEWLVDLSKNELKEGDPDVAGSIRDSAFGWIATKTNPAAG